MLLGIDKFLRGAQHCLLQNLKNNIDLCLKFPMSPVKEKSEGGEGYCTQFYGLSI